jgi:hypothetical protein
MADVSSQLRDTAPPLGISSSITFSTAGVPFPRGDVHAGTLRLMNFASDDSVAIQLPPSGAFAFDEAPFGALMLRLHVPGFGRARATLGAHDDAESTTIAAGGECTDVRIVVDRR